MNILYHINSSGLYLPSEQTSPSRHRLAHEFWRNLRFWPMSAGPLHIKDSPRRFTHDIWKSVRIIGWWQSKALTPGASQSYMGRLANTCKHGLVRGSCHKSMGSWHARPESESETVGGSNIKSEPESAGGSYARPESTGSSYDRSEQKALPQGEER
jgi:hypothetical protein